MELEFLNKQIRLCGDDDTRIYDELLKIVINSTTPTREILLAMLKIGGTRSDLKKPIQAEQNRAIQEVKSVMASY